MDGVHKLEGFREKIPVINLPGYGQPESQVMAQYPFQNPCQVGVFGNAEYKMVKIEVKIHDFLVGGTGIKSMDLIFQIPELLGFLRGDTLHGPEICLDFHDHTDFRDLTDTFKAQGGDNEM